MLETRNMRDAYVAQMKEKLDRWNAEIDDLQASVDHVSAGLREEFERRLEELRAKQRAAEEQLDEARRTGEGVWHDLEVGMDLAWEDLGAAVRAASQRLRS